MLTRHPAVADAAVFGIPHPEWGQEIKAVLEPDSGAAIDIDDVAAFATTHLARFKRPASYDVIEQLPREAHGKLKKRLLRDPY